ncbi:SDR family oxidoreductase [Emcibacter sp.]|uniref:SDR family NAD(P)-dependent oxidoreductase n=1 Tax=Emcibacter sp. TaxID=1979954 RepID=UPI002AA68826|nr:SDR family oxidoreductase [Emcibacter sp.]
MILGAGPGLGQALANCFCREGFHVFLVARDKGRLDDQVEALSRKGYTASSIVCDLTKPEQLVQMCTRFMEKHEAPDILVYNAFRRLAGTAPDMELDDTINVFNVNVWGAVRTVQFFYPGMKKRGHGTILVTGGGAAIDLWPELVPLGMSKAALRNYCLNLAETAIKDGVHVATVTICGHIRAGGRYDPGEIAEVYLSLHRQTPDFWQGEYLFK